MVRAMPAEQRIIGGGLLIVGIAVALILLYLFNWGGMSAPDAVKELETEFYPAYAKAEADRDYVGMRRLAERALAVIEKGGAVGVTKQLQGTATGGSREAKRLYEIVKDGTLEKNAEGLFEFKGEWFKDGTHRHLGDLADAIDGRMKVLRLVRATAEEAAKAIEDARIGSGKPLEIPEAKAVEAEELPITSPNPVFDHDRELFRVFGLRAETVAEALATPNPSGKATSSRLRWNRDIVTSGLAKQIEGLPEQVEEMKSLAVRIELSARGAAEDPAAQGALAALLQRGADAVAARLPDPAKKAFDERRALFARGDVLARVLRREAVLLSPYLPAVRALGATFATEFVK